MMNENALKVVPKNWVLRPAPYNCTNCVEAEFPCFQSRWGSKGCYHCNKYGYTSSCKPVGNSRKSAQQIEKEWLKFFKGSFSEVEPERSQDVDSAHKMDDAVVVQPVPSKPSRLPVLDKLGGTELDERKIAWHLFQHIQEKPQVLQQLQMENLQMMQALASNPHKRGSDSNDDSVQSRKKLCP